ncbi:MAG: transporter, family, multidrug resistance protein [Chloroflexota bacterium]|jgi:MFS family permease|nr:transporter, family, multidrug resistance protein [Chloroflexota bacterium]
MIGRVWTLARQHEALVIVAMYSLSIFLAWHIVVSVLPSYALAFGVTLAQVGLLISALTLGRVFFNFPAGTMSERVGRRPVLIVGGIITAIASFGSGSVQDFGQLVAVRFLTGVGGAMAITTSMAIVADLSTTTNRARMMSANDSLVNVGLFMAPGVGGILADAFGLRVPFFVAGLAMVITTIWVFLRLPETRGLRHDDTPATIAEARPGPLESIKALVQIRNYDMVALLGFGTFLTRFAGLFLLLPTIGRVRFGMTPGEYGLLASALALVQVPIWPFAGTLADRFGRKPVIVPSTIATGVMIVCIGLAPTRELFYLCVLLYAVTAGVSGPAPSAYLADVVPRPLRGMGMGAYRTFGDFAGFVGPLALGALATILGEGTAVIFNGVVVVVTAIIFALFAGETLRPRKAPEPIAAGP